MQPLYKCVPTAKDGILEGTLPKVSNKALVLMFLASIGKWLTCQREKSRDLSSILLTGPFF